METPNYRKASIYFDDETVLEVQQRGGGGAGVAGENGLAAVNLVTGESTNDAIAEKDETIEQQAATIEQQARTIEEQAGTIDELREELADVPTIEELYVTANGTYSVTGKAYSPVMVDVASAHVILINATFINNTNSNIIVTAPNIGGTANYDDVVLKEIIVNANSTLQNQYMNVLHRSVNSIFIRPIIKDAAGNSVAVNQFTISNVSQRFNFDITGDINDNKIKFGEVGVNTGTISCTLTINSLT